MLTRVLAQELWRDNIQRQRAVPGPAMAERARETYSGSSDSVFSIESEWIKGPEDVVPLVMLLATQPDVGPTAQGFSLMRRDI